MSLASHSDRRPQADDARPGQSGLPPRRHGSDALSDCTSDRAPQARKGAPLGVSSLDLRRRDGSAGDAAFSGAHRAALARRDRAIREAYFAGQERKDIARIHGVTRTRVSQILHASKDSRRLARAEMARRAEAREAAFLARIDDLLSEYQCGFTLQEIADRHGVTRPRISHILTCHPDYQGRAPAHIKGLHVVVPASVPDRHVARFRRLARANGNAAAEICIRNMIAWEAR